MAITQIKTVATATAQIEFQLVNSIHHGTIGRLYIPASLRGTGKVLGKLIYDSDRSSRNCNYKSRTIEFIGSIAEYRRCLKEYASSNMAVNRVRTLNLMEQLTAEIKGQALPIVPVEAKQEDVCDSPTDREILNLQAHIDEMSSDGDLDASDINTLYKRIDELTNADIDNAPVDSQPELATVEQLRQLKSKQLKNLLKEHNIQRRSKLTTVGQMAGALLGIVKVAHLPYSKLETILSTAIAEADNAKVVAQQALDNLQDNQEKLDQLADTALAKYPVL